MVRPPRFDRGRLQETPHTLRGTPEYRGSRMFSAANRNAPDPHVGSNAETVAHRVPERAQQLRPLALYDDVSRASRSMFEV